MVGLSFWAWQRIKQGSIPATARTQGASNETIYAGHIIKALEGFDWAKAQPLQFRPFQGKDRYNLSMGKV